MAALGYESDTFGYQAGEQQPKTFAQRYDALSDWLENLRILVPVLIISCVHYTKVLWTHDGPILAPLIAITLDVTHFGSLKQFVKVRKWYLKLGWGIAALLLTAWAFALQYRFYAGDWSFKVDAVVYAGLMPLIVIVTAFREVKQEVKRGVGYDKLPDSVALDIQASEGLVELDSFEGMKGQIISKLQNGDEGLSRNKLSKLLNTTPTTLGKHANELIKLGVLIDKNGLYISPKYKAMEDLA